MRLLYKKMSNSTALMDTRQMSFLGIFKHRCLFPSHLFFFYLLHNCLFLQCSHLGNYIATKDLPSFQLSYFFISCDNQAIFMKLLLFNFLISLCNDGECTVIYLIAFGLCLIHTSFCLMVFRLNHIVASVHY